MMTALLCAAVIVAAAPVDAAAEAYPARSVRLVVTFPPGGAVDLVGRILAQKLAELLGQSVLVDNRPGGGQIIGSEIVARSAADGYTLLLPSITHAINPALHARLPYDTLRDFAPISLAAASPQLLVAHPALPARSVQELIALARAKPGQINYASSGNGSGGHLAMELFRSISGIALTHVPYKGAGPAVVDVVAGQVQLMFTSPLAVSQQIRTGKLVALGIASAQRSSAWPDLPTIAESGVRGYSASLWYGLLAPARTPEPALRVLEAAAVKAVRAPEVRERLLAQAVDPVGSSAREFDAFLREELKKWASVIRNAGIRLD